MSNKREGLVEVSNEFVTDKSLWQKLNEFATPIRVVETRLTSAVWLMESPLFEIGCNAYSLQFTRDEKDKLSCKAVAL